MYEFYIDHSGDASKFITCEHKLWKQVVLAMSQRPWNCPIIMKTTLHKSSERGHADHGWLDSWHSFSFADYYNPARMGFRSLRVINQDQVAPGGGFPPHPHRDMEIFSYVVAGRLEHKDSLGNGRQLKPGEIQLMSAGTGVTHSEFNPSRNELLRFLQIWIKPGTQGLRPNYSEWRPSPETEHAAKVLVISPDGRDNSATIHQDAEIWRILIKAGESTHHDLTEDRGLWFQLHSS